MFAMMPASGDCITDSNTNVMLADSTDYVLPNITLNDADIKLMRVVLVPLCSCNVQCDYFIVRLHIKRTTEQY